MWAKTRYHDDTWLCLHACLCFCNVATGRPDKLDPHEPERVADAVAFVLAHVVITSVDRDDLSDGGAQHLLMLFMPSERLRFQQPLKS